MSEYMDAGNWDDNAPERIDSRCLFCEEMYSRDVDDVSEDYCSEECFIAAQREEAAAERAAQQDDEKSLEAEVQREAALAAISDDDEPEESEPDYCRVCDGTGEGRASDTRCGYCRGTGYERRRMEVEP